MIEMSVEFVRVSMQNYNRVVILREKEADRYLLIWIGASEAEAIAMRLGDVQPPRPQTHDLMRNIIDALGATVSYILVNDLNNDTFYARIVLEANGRTVEEVREFITADTLHYISLDGLIRAIDHPAKDLCLGCLTGVYPLELPGEKFRGLEPLEAFGAEASPIPAREA